MKYSYLATSELSSEQFCFDLRYPTYTRLNICLGEMRCLTQWTDFFMYKFNKLLICLVNLIL